MATQNKWHVVDLGRGWYRGRWKIRNSCGEFSAMHFSSRREAAEHCRDRNAQAVQHETTTPGCHDCGADRETIAFAGAEFGPVSERVCCA